MSSCHSDMFSLKGGKCPPVILTGFPISRKMPYRHSDKFSLKGEKCPTVILTSFQKKEENIQLSFGHVFTKRRKMSHSHTPKFLQKGGKCATGILTSFHKKEENVHTLTCRIIVQQILYLS